MVADLHDLMPRFIDGADRWFDTQLLEVFGVDALAEPFDPERGFQATQRPRIEHVTIRLDRLNAVYPSALRAVTGRTVRHMPASNVAAVKAYSGHRRAVLDAFVLSEADVARAASTRVMAHFFTPTERDRLVEQWMTGPQR